MTKKILAGVIGVSLIIMLVCVGLVMGIMYDYMGQKIDEQMADEAILAEEAWLTGGEEFLHRMEDRPDIKNRITVISSDGEVLYDSVADSSKMENHLEREEVKEALAEGTGKASRTSYTLEEDTRYYAKKTADGNVIRISTSHYSQLGLLLDTFGMILITVAVLIVLSVFISYRVARAIIKPINDIDLDNPDISENYEELGPLLHRIHQQNSRIKRQMENLRRSREEFNIITENMSEGLIIIDKD
ncbi:MAG: histidine kinase, partial [Firmicutes bacterium]|nr:histidine kinase [Bacillota bacterium]